MSAEDSLEVLFLRLQVDQVDKFLYGVCALFVAADFDEVLGDAFEDEHALIGGAVDEEALTEVVTVVIYH